jgi:hypothetical protein
LLSISSNPAKLIHQYIWSSYGSPIPSSYGRLVAAAATFLQWVLCVWNPNAHCMLDVFFLQLHVVREMSHSVHSHDHECGNIWDHGHDVFRQLWELMAGQPTGLLFSGVACTQTDMHHNMYQYHGKNHNSLWPLLHPICFAFLGNEPQHGFLV